MLVDVAQETKPFSMKSSKLAGAYIRNLDCPSIIILGGISNAIEGHIVGDANDGLAVTTNMFPCALNGGIIADDDVVIHDVILLFCP